MAGTIADTVVVAAGEMRNRAYWAATLGQAARVICADGGLAHCQELDIKTDLVVGDFDSLAGDGPDGGSSPAGHPQPEAPAYRQYRRDKAISDSALAVQHAFEQGAERVVMLGGVGSRLDHSQANQLLLAAYPGRLRLADGDFEAVALCLREAQGDKASYAGAYNGARYGFDCAVGDTVSLIPIDPIHPTRLSASGLKYPLDNLELQCASHGLSNVTSGNRVEITLHQGALLCWRIWEPYSNREALRS